MSPRDLDRIRASVRFTETLVRNPDSPTPAGDAGAETDFQSVNVTSTTPTGGLYPAEVQVYDSSTATWTVLGTCWAIDRGGNAPTTRPYSGERVGDDPSGVPIYLVDAPTSGPVTSVTGTNPIQVSPTTGAVVVSVLDASHTQSGIVNLSNQVLGAGTKTMRAVESTTLYMSDTNGVGTSDLTNSYMQGVFSKSLTAGSGVVQWQVSSQTGSDGIFNGFGMFIFMDWNTTESWTAGSTSSNAVFYVSGRIESSVGYAVGTGSPGSAGYHAGQTGTGGGGDTFTGGLCTGLGSAGTSGTSWEGDTLTGGKVTALGTGPTAVGGFAY